MSRRVLLGKAASDYGLFISKIGVDVVNDSGTLCNKDFMIFDSREKGYTQVIKKGTIDVSRGSSNAHTETFSSIAIPNPVVIIYADGNYIELTSVSTTAFILTVPNTYPTISTYGYTLHNTSTHTGEDTPNTTTVNFIVLRGYA
jgi:hypothetical protein